MRRPESEDLAAGTETARPALPWVAWVAAPVFVVAAIVTLFLLIDRFGAGAPPVFGGLVFLTACAFVGLLVSALSRTRGPIDLCYYIYLAYFLLAPAAMQVATDRFPWDPVRHTMADTVHTTWLIGLAMIGYEVGRQLHRRRPPTGSVFATPLTPTPMLTLFALGCGLAGLLSIPLVGIDTLLGSRGELARMQGMETRTLYQLFLTGQGLALAGAVLILALVYNRKLVPPETSWLRPILLGTLLFVLPLALFLYNPLVNARFVVAGCLLAFFYVAFRRLFQATKILIVLAFPFLIFYVLPAIKLLGEAEARARFFEVLANRRFDYLFTVDFDTFQASANVVRFVDDRGLLGLQNLLSVPFFFVPRGLWPDKPFPSGMTVFDQLGYWYTNVSTPLFMEFYVAAGLLAVPLGMAFVGWLVSRIERRAAFGGSSTARTGGDVLVALIGGFTIIVMRGALGGVMAWVGPPIVAALIALLLLARRERNATEPEPGDIPAASRLGDRWADDAPRRHPTHQGVGDRVL